MQSELHFRALPSSGADIRGAWLEVSAGKQSQKQRELAAIAGPTWLVILDSLLVIF